jgi:hypothetical protein
MRYMTTPGGCMNASCAGAGGTDSMAMTWADANSWCANMNFGGYKDWFLPSKEQLNDVLYANKAALGGFTSSIYWSSTRDTAYSSWGEQFSDGSPTRNGTPGINSVRCVRRYSN